MKKTALSLLLAFLVLTCRETDMVLPNRPPIADAGQDVSVLSGQMVILNGSDSFDPDEDPLSYSWSFISVPAGSQAALQHFDSVICMFTPDRVGTFRIRLLVSDNVESDADTVEVTSLQGNVPPLVNAGNDRQVNLGTQVNLTGTASDPDGDPLTINWILVNRPSGSAAVIQNPGSLNALVVIDKHGTYLLRLQVSDGNFTVNDEMTITTNPVAVTSINPTIGPRGITVKINGNNFSSTIAENQVTFNGMTATVTASTYTTIDAVVPVGAGTGPVAVRVNNITNTGPVFTYLLTAIVNTVAQFNRPIFMVADADGNVYISDYNNHVIRRLTPGGQLSTIAGSGQAGYADGALLEAQFNQPVGIAIDANNNLYVADNNNHCIRRISLSAGTVSTFAGFIQSGYVDGVGGQALFNSPIGVACDLAGNIYVGDSGNSRIRKITPAAVVSTLAGNGQNGFSDGQGAEAIFNGIAGVAVDGSANIYVADLLNHRVRRITPQGAVTTLAGNGTASFANGTGTAARFNAPYGVACDASANVFVADFNNHSIRRVTPQGVVTTIAGTGVAGFADGSNAQFNQPTGVTVLPNGTIYVSDHTNQRVRRITFE